MKSKTILFSNFKYDYLNKNENINTLSIDEFSNLKTDNGYIESEIEREIREGFLLCPTIKQVTSYESEKVGTKLCLEISVELQGGASLEIESELNE